MLLKKVFILLSKKMLKIKYLIFLTYLLKRLLRLLKITYLTLEKTDYSTKVNEILKKITDHNHINILLLQNLLS